MKKPLYFFRHLFLISLIWLTGINCFAQGEVAPEFTICPGPITKALCSPVVDYNAQAAGNPAPTYTYSISGVTIGSGSGTGTGTSFNNGESTVTIVASNTAGSDTCTFMVSIISIPPVFTSCPTDITVTSDVMSCGKIVTYDTPLYEISCPSTSPAPFWISGFSIIGYLNGHKYLLSNNASTWQVANSYAQSLGGHLIAISSAEENAIATQAAITAGASVYIGASDYLSEGNWVWSNGEPFSYTNWNPYEPNNSGDYGEDYGQIMTNGAWNDINESTELRYIIEFDSYGFELISGLPSGSLFPVGSTTNIYRANDIYGNVDSCSFTVTVLNEPPVFTNVPHDTTVYTGAEECGKIITYSEPAYTASCPCTASTPSSISSFSVLGYLNGHKYFVSNYSTYWSAANSTAQYLGGHLMTISSAEENALAAQAATQYGYSIFVGANDISTEGTWVWSNGEPFTYTNWNIGEPNNNNYNGEDAVEVLTNGTWNDLYENEYRLFIVEFDCHGLELTSGLPSGSTFPAGTTVNSFTVSDTKGNTASCSFTVTVIDTTPPKITCPGDQTIHCQSDYIVMPVGQDNCMHEGPFYTVKADTYAPFDMSGASPWSCNDGGYYFYMPFNFKYFDNYYSSLYVFCNGFVTLGQYWPGVGEGCCNGQTLPNANFENSIAVNWSDLNGTLSLKEFGSAPDRIFVIQWSGTENYSSSEYNVQLALYEGSNNIKIITIRNDSFTSHSKTMGLSNNGNIALVVDGRNNTNWTVSNECLLFEPSAPVQQVDGPTPGYLPIGTSTLTYAVTDNSGNTATCSFNVTYEPYLMDYVLVGEGGNYPTLTGEGGLFQAINSSGICGEFRAIIISDIEEPGTYALNNITYGDPNNDMLAIGPYTFNTYYIYGNTTQALLRLNGADNVYITGDWYGMYGQNLYFENLNPTGPVIEFTNGAYNNRVSGSVFASNNSNANSGVVVIGGTNTTEGNTYIEFDDNVFRNSPGIAGYPANLFYSMGNDIYPNGDIDLYNNQFINFDQKAINVTSTGNGSYWDIEENSFYFTDMPVTKANKIFINFTPGENSYYDYIGYNMFGGTAAYAQGYPLQISGAGTTKAIVANSQYSSIYNNDICNFWLSGTGITNFTGIEIPSGDIGIYDNVIGHNRWNDYNISVAGTGTITGILSASTYFPYIEVNRIDGIIFTKSTGSPVFKGIQIKSGYVGNNEIKDVTTTGANLSPTIYGICNIASGLTEPNYIVNNMISINSGKSLKPKVYGLFDQSIGIGADFVHNSVWIQGNTTNGYFTAALYRIGNATTVAYNNILINTRVANVYAKHFAIHTNSQLNWMSDHNVLFTTSGCLGNWGGATYANLTAWRLMTGQDMNSLYLMPEFMALDDLHLVEWSTVNDILPLIGGSEYTDEYDFDWNYRNPWNPTPGADELYSSGGGDRIEPEAQVENDVESNSMTVYPNPLISNATVSINLTQDNDIIIEMYNTIGEKVMEIANGNYSAGPHTFNIDAISLPAGTYLCRYMVNGSESIMKRVEIVK